MKMSSIPMLMTMMMMAMITKDIKPVSASQPSVSLGNSTLYGTTFQVGNATVNQFLGVRFAEPPVGPLRFRKPVAASLPAVVNATTLPHPCPGLTSILPMDEDCLFLSIYAPTHRRQNGVSKVPVMVWIYGGGFVFGSSDQYDGSVLAAEGNVIVVTLNYRVGPLGFLSTGDNSSVGNYGLWDQWLALNWVRHNIGHFGGDVTNITLFGESAGAASVSYHMTSPHSQGLFHRAILQSGSRQGLWAVDKEALSHTRSLATTLSCSDTSSTSAMVSCLREIPWRTLMTVVLLLPIWAPVLDGDFVLPEDQWPTFHGPFMIGVNNWEGGLLLSVHKRKVFGANDRANHLAFLQELLGELYPSLAAAASPPELALAARVVDCVYRREGSTDSWVTDAELEELVGDVDIVLGSQQFLNEEPASGAIYYYYFDHYPDNIKNGHKGMDHALDIEYTFGFLTGTRAVLSPFLNKTVSKRDQRVATRFRALLTNFAHSGNPNHPTEIASWPAWPPYTKDNQSYLAITDTSRVASRPKGDVMRVWLETVPAVLRSQGVEGMEDSPWPHCTRLSTSYSPPGISSSMWMTLGISMIAIAAGLV